MSNFSTSSELPLEADNAQAHPDDNVGYRLFLSGQDPAFNAYVEAVVADCNTVAPSIDDTDHSFIAARMERVRQNLDQAARTRQAFRDIVDAAGRPYEHDPDYQPSGEQRRQRSIPRLLGRCGIGMVQALKRFGESSVGVTSAAILAPLEYWLETPLIDNEFSHLAPNGPFSGVREAVITLGLLSIVAASNYLVARASNKVPVAVLAADERRRGGAAHRATETEPTRSLRQIGIQLGKTALHGAKGAITKGWDAGWTVLGLPWRVIGRAGEKLERSKHAAIRAVGSVAVDTCMAVTMGPAFTVLVEKAGTGEEVAEPRIRRLSLLIAAGWFPAYYLVSGLIHGAYDGLQAMTVHAEAISNTINSGIGKSVQGVSPGEVAAVTNGVDTGLHVAFDRFGDLTNIGTLDGKVAMSALTLGVAAWALRNSRRNQQQAAISRTDSSS